MAQQGLRVITREPTEVTGLLMGAHRLWVYSYGAYMEQT